MKAATVAMSSKEMGSYKVFRVSASKKPQNANLR
jgi:hypothetical protein